MNFKEWLNESDEKQSETDKPVADKQNPVIEKLNKHPKSQRTLPNYKEDRWRLNVMKWRNRWLENNAI